MELEIRQMKKELFGAAFEIWEDSTRQTGSIAMKGRPGSMEGSFQIEYNGAKIQMSPTGRRKASAAAKPLIKRLPFRPYAISGGVSEAVMFHDQIKTGFMKSAGYHLLLWESAAYYLYFVGFGEAGICAPVYRGEDYIAEIRKDCAVKDDLHTMSIVLYEPSYAAPLILLSCYMYVITYYKAGEKTLHGVQKKLIYTKNDFLLSKCRTRPDGKR